MSVRRLYRDFGEPEEAIGKSGNGAAYRSPVGTRNDLSAKRRELLVTTTVQVKWETIDKFPRSRLRQLRFANTESELC